ncbi:hypothetical protein BaRGS_00008794 [Batillaria attramentaria]|uniref:Uncharacterized protein n=1 Tax=Batillaria attramentaria TaxID=370345 RepID=A0ABD0LKA1_9CAEN
MQSASYDAAHLPPSAQRNPLSVDLIKRVGNGELHSSLCCISSSRLMALVKSSSAADGERRDDNRRPGADDPGRSLSRDDESDGVSLLIARVSTRREGHLYVAAYTRVCQ